MISDNKHHITYTAEDIQRYWNGQLTSQEMHAMEKAALDDPFLADAMEGMGEALRVHDEQLVNAELNNLHQQLQARTETKREAPVRSFNWWQAAAAAVILIIGGYWIFSSNPEKAASDLAQKTSAPQKENTKAAAPAIADSEDAKKDAAATDSIAVTSGVGAFSKVSDQPVALEEKEKKSENGYYKFKTPEPSANKDTTDAYRRLDSRASGVAIDKNVRGEEKSVQLVDRSVTAKPVPLSVAKSDSDKQVPTEVVTLQGDLQGKRNERVAAYDNNVRLQNIVKGVVTDNKNNPLANAFIRLDDKSAFTTDVKGNFNIPVTDSVVQVSVSSPGFSTQNFRLRTDNFDNAGRANQTLNQIQLQPTNGVLDEVVVTGYGKQRKKGLVSENKKGEYYPTAQVQNANPTYGWLAYEEYIEKNKRVPPENPNLVGEVVLSFAVSRRGDLSEFKVEKSLSPQHDAEAERLVRQGPSWKLQTRGRKSRVTVIVRF